MHLPRGSVGSGRPVFPRQVPTSSTAFGGAAAAAGDASDGGGGGFGGPPGFGGGGFRGGFGRGGKGHGFPPFGGGGGFGGGAGGGAGGGTGGGGNTGGDGSTGTTTNNACPQTNGTTIGSVQSFILLCDSAVGGDVINSTTVSTFDECTVACASFHPKCEAVSFDGTTCSLKANLASSVAASSTTLNGGVGQFPPASSNCGTLGASVTQSNMNFNLFCNNVIDGADLTQNNAATLQDCMDQCVSTSGCGAVSYDASYSNGFKNCYLKTTGPPGPIVDTGIDTAVMGNAVAAADSSSSSVVAATSSSSVSSAAAPSTTNAGVITVPPPQPSIVTQTVVSVVTSISDSVSRTIATTEVITVPMLSGSTLAGGGVATATGTGAMTMTGAAISTMAAMSSSTASASLVSSTDSSSNSRAWIAAPVVGSVAAVMVVAVMFVLWGRRRRNNGLSSPLSPAFLFNRFRGGGGNGGNGSSGFRNLSSADSNTAPETRTILPFGNYWRAGGKDKKDDYADNGMSEKYGNSGMARKVVDEETSGGNSSRAGTGNGKSVPLIIDTGLARNSSSKGKSNIVAVAVTTDAAERAVRDKGKETSESSSSSRPTTSSNSSSEKPVPSRDLTSQHEKGKVVLRDSMNGLAQNRTTLDGIPIFLRE
ncbi:hypothetical protein SEUCBS140593_007902 [Sporothrix eucalyptigena]|uniref:Apple domain-containing protein n=1 Tax=Sporothrix eucalyptigena TaxID=1812306 RepID=A0ABP0CH43_9PEZI